MNCHWRTGEKTTSLLLRSPSRSQLWPRALRLPGTVCDKIPEVLASLTCADIQFDDLDPADDELDSIADGQLYRLRRGASYINQQKFGGRAGHVGRGGRGGRGAFNGNQQTFATRGGRGDRGFAATRGGHASPGRGGARVNRDNARRYV